MTVTKEGLPPNVEEILENEGFLVTVYKDGQVEVINKNTDTVDVKWYEKSEFEKLRPVLDL